MKRAVDEGRTAPADEGNARPEPTGDPLNDNLQQGYHFLNAHDYARAAKYFRLDIKENPDTPEGYRGLAKARSRSGDFKGSTEVRLEALKRCKVGTADWAETWVECFTGLCACPEVPRPLWWTDEELLSLTKRALTRSEANAENEPLALVWAVHARATVLASTHKQLPFSLRTAVQYIEAVKCYERAAHAAAELHAAGVSGMACYRGWADEAKNLRAHLNSVLRGGPPNPHESK